MASQATPPATVTGLHWRNQQSAWSENCAFERLLFSCLGGALDQVEADISAGNLSRLTGPQIAPSRWNGLLTEIYRPLCVEPRSAQLISELLCRCVINAENLLGVVALAKQFPGNGLLPKMLHNSRENLISIYLDTDSHKSALSILQLTSYLKLFSWLIGTRIPVLQAQVHTFEKGRALEEIEEIFDCTFSSNHQQSALVFHSLWLQFPVIRTYADLRFVLGLPSLALIPWPSPASIRFRVTQLITKTISRHGQAPSLGEVASLLGRSSSTLRRQLQQEGTSFQRLKDAWRLQQAKELLQSERPLAEIASTLGFESNSVFSRAFKSWTGVAPSMFRAIQNPSKSTSDTIGAG